MAKKKATRKKMATRRQYSAKRRAEILAAATKEKLTAAAVQKRFGVKPVTYYSWRRKAGVGKGRGRLVAARGTRDELLESQLRSELQARMKRLLPDLVKTEVSAYLDAALGSRGKGRRK